MKPDYNEYNEFFSETEDGSVRPENWLLAPIRVDAVRADAVQADAIRLIPFSDAKLKIASYRCSRKLLSKVQSRLTVPTIRANWEKELLLICKQVVCRAKEITSHRSLIWN